MGAKFCVECGNSLYEKKKPKSVEEPAESQASSNEADNSIFQNGESEPVFEAKENNDNAGFSGTIPEPEPSTYENAAEIWQLKQAFFDALKKRVEEEHPPAQYESFIDRLETSGFHEILNINVRNIYGQVERMRLANEPVFKLETLRHISFENLLDTFIIRHCSDLIPIPLPEKILKYQDFREEELFEMVLDYLDLEKEPEPVYLDFIKMPIKKLQAASKKFLKTEKEEKIFFICDQSIAGSCREGFAMTDRALYWRAHLLPAQRIDYRHIISVAREQDWILINEHFFNVNPSLNLKVMKLLKKLQRSV